MNTVLLQQPRQVYFGPGVRAKIPALLATSGWRRAFVVAGGHVLRHQTDLLDAWRKAGCELEVCTEIDREPEIALFERVRSQASAFRPDGVIGIGGGSPLDVAKLVAALVDDNADVRSVFGIGKLAGRRKGLICIPTTAGTGSEVSPNAILLDESERLKKGVVSPHLVPDMAFLDPELTVTTPPAVTAATGYDALVHCLEAYANRFAHPAVDGMALEGIRRISTYLEAAVRDGKDLEARSQVMLGAYAGGLCLGPVNTAAVHALAYPLGGEFRVPHGVANSLLLVPVLKFNLPAAPGRYAAIARAAGAEIDADEQRQAEAGLECLATLARRSGIPTRLCDVGVAEDDLLRLAGEAMKVTRLLKNNLRELTEADALAIYRDAF